MIRTETSPTDAERTARAGVIEKAYKDGVITLTEYQRKMAENQSSTPRISPGKRPMGDVHHKDYEGAWRTIADFPDYQSALQAVKSDKFGRYKWAPSPGKPGDRRLVCNMHVDCEHMLRLREGIKAGDPVQLVQVHATLEHTSVEKTKRRKNSAMTVEQEELAKAGIRDGNHAQFHTYHIRIIHVSYLYHDLRIAHVHAYHARIMLVS